MSLTEELARIRIAEARQAADQIARQNQLGFAEEKNHPLRGLLMAALTSAENVILGSAEQLRRLRNLGDRRSTSL